MAREIALATAVAVVVACGLSASRTSLYTVPSTATSTTAYAPVSLSNARLHAATLRRTTNMENPASEGQDSVGRQYWATGSLVSCCIGALAAAVLALRKKVTEVDVEAVLLHSGQAAGGLALSAALASSAMAASLSYDQIQGVSYMDMKGTGLSNQCPVLAESNVDVLNLKPGNYKMESMCLEPSSFQVKLPSDGKTVTDFEKTKLMTRLTYTLDGIRADLRVDNGGSWTLKEIDGLDYAATTVKLAGGESVPFLFTIRNLEAHGTAGQLVGQFEVPSYRGATFMDPRSRGGATGYDYQQGLQAAGDQEEYRKENVKNLTPQSGTIAFKVARADAETGEIAGVFESIQASDNDMGAKESKEVKASGVWYGRISPA